MSGTTEHWIHRERREHKAEVARLHVQLQDWMSKYRELKDSMEEFLGEYSAWIPAQVKEWALYRMTVAKAPTTSPLEADNMAHETLLRTIDMTQMYSDQVWIDEATNDLHVQVVMADGKRCHLVSSFDMYYKSTVSREELALVIARNVLARMKLEPEWKDRRGWWRND